MFDSFLFFWYSFSCSNHHFIRHLCAKNKKKWKEKNEMYWNSNDWINNNIKKGTKPDLCITRCVKSKKENQNWTIFYTFFIWSWFSRSQGRHFIIFYIYRLPFKKRFLPWRIVIICNTGIFFISLLSLLLAIVSFSHTVDSMTSNK